MILLSGYPHVENYRRTVQLLDKKQFVIIRLITFELRNHYVNHQSEFSFEDENISLNFLFKTSVHDLLMKNLERIKKLRSISVNSFH